MVVLSEASQFIWLRSRFYGDLVIVYFDSMLLAGYLVTIIILICQLSFTLLFQLAKTNQNPRKFKLLPKSRDASHQARLVVRQ